MKNATIEIRTRDVSNIPYIPLLGKGQHLFIIFNNTKGIPNIIRGGPDTNMVLGDIKIISAPYEAEFKHLFPGDWVENAPAKVIARGTDAERCKCCSTR